MYKFDQYGLAVATLGLLGLAATFFPLLPKFRHLYSQKQAAWHVGIGATILIVLYGVANLTAYGISQIHSPTASAQDTAEAFRLQSGNAYPLAISEELGGSPVSTSVMYGGVFTASKIATTTDKYGNALRVLPVSFNVGRQAWMLNVPVDKITYHMSDSDALPEMTIRLTDQYYPGTTVKDSYGPCSVVLYDLLTTCAQQPVSRVITIDQHTLQQGLPAVLQKDGAIGNVDITLSRAMYQALGG